MKYLGIDYGTKRVGIATSDDGGTMAFPFCTLQNTDTLIQDVITICRDEHIDTIVVGESQDRSGNPNPVMAHIMPFFEKLKITSGIPVEFMNEAYSSREAAHIQGDNEHNDASAAAIVLQSYLDRTQFRNADKQSGL